MFRVLPIAGVAVASLGLTGCAGVWDTVTSRGFRNDPFNTTYKMMRPEDPVLVLTADPPRSGDERAKAMRRLKEPLKAGGDQRTQDAVVDVLGWAATSDPSPVVRLAAIDALGRFGDPRAPGILVAAYQKADGRPEGAPRPADPGVVPAGGAAGRTRTPAREFLLTPPTGFPPETAAVIRCRSAESLGRTGSPEAVRFLAVVAGGGSKDTTIEGADDREVRLAAVRGLGKCRQPDAVVALAQVLATETAKDKDTAVIGRAHDGLVRLTGKHLPPDPRKWDEVIQAGVIIVPEPSWVESAVENAAAWVTWP